MVSVVVSMEKERNAKIFGLTNDESVRLSKDKSEN